MYTTTEKKLSSSCLDSVLNIGLDWTYPKLRVKPPATGRSTLSNFVPDTNPHGPFHLFNVVHTR